MDPHPAAVVLQVTGRAHLQSRSADPLCSALSSISPFPCLVYTWLRAAGYLKTSNACEALTISGDCCWVISGKEVSLQFPQPPQRASHTHTFTHTYTIPVRKTTHNACKRKHTDSLSSAPQSIRIRWTVVNSGERLLSCTVACEEMQYCLCG